jgi:hypothetical protein
MPLPNLPPAFYDAVKPRCRYKAYAGYTRTVPATYRARNMEAGRSTNDGKIRVRVQPSGDGCGSWKWGLLMPRTHRWTFIFLVLLLTFQGAVAQTQTKPQTKPHRKSHKALPKLAVLPPVLPPLPRGPLPQLPLDLMPAAPPRVSYQNGMLTIVAQNSTLGDILRDVHKLTGASIETPPNATERVVTRLGPGAPRDVLASLLNGSAFNYVMMGSSANPAGLASVVLTAKPVAGAAPTAANPYQPAQSIYTAPIPVPQASAAPVVTQPVAAEAEDNANADEQDAADENADQIQTEGQQPDATGTAQQQLAQPQQQPGQPNAGPKTPEQILELLRQQQAQPPNPPPPDD